jgi:hypothetical protein
MRALVHLIAVKRLQISRKEGNEFLDQFFRNGICPVEWVYQQ